VYSRDHARLRAPNDPLGRAQSPNRRRGKRSPHHRFLVLLTSLAVTLVALACAGCDSGPPCYELRTLYNGVTMTIPLPCPSGPPKFDEKP
jgi:hypothetical protein